MKELRLITKGGVEITLFQTFGYISIWVHDERGKVFSARVSAASRPPLQSPPKTQPIDPEESTP